MSSSWRAAALDIGSTRVKLGALRSDGTLDVVASEPFPLLAGGGERYAIDALELLRVASGLFELVPRRVPFGIASQRSSFVLWERASGALACEALSWRDRRAAAWCERRRELAPDVERYSGLRLSPHYVGPKLAALFEADRALAARARDGQLAFGTLETFLAWHWSERKLHVTDASMAARTLLADPRSAQWSPPALERFGVPPAVLPEIVDTCGRDGALDGRRRLAASIADQASGLLAAAQPHDALVNLGTGAFVLRAAREFAPLVGYLCGPTLWTRERHSFAHEGTLNGGSATLARLGAVTTALEARDREPDLFASPDESGLGAPRWRADATLRFSRDAATLAPEATRRAFLEGLVFRLREMLDALAPGAARVLVSGGVAREPFLAPALATVLGREVELLDEFESTLLGVARLAAGVEAWARPTTTTVAPDPQACWLREKYPRWRAWMATQWP